MTLYVEGLSVRYGSVLAVEDISLEVKAGECVALVGSNGAGKSSTLKGLMALVDHSVASMTLNGQSVKTAATRARIRAGLALSPEGRHVFPLLTVRENIDLGYLGNDASEQADLREAMFRQFERLRERAWQSAGSLSGGEQQMLAIARAAMSRPKVLLLDEPTLGLAPMVVQLLSRAIRQFCEGGMGVILAEQNAEMALGVADRGYVIQGGRVILHDSAQSLRGNETVKVAYMGL